MRPAILLGASLLPACWCLSTNFPWENVQVTDANAFGDPLKAHAPNITCKVHPGDADYPSPSAWSAFNDTLNGHLLHPSPLASPCYPSLSTYDTALCEFVEANFANTSLHASDPTSIVAYWPEGNTCLPPDDVNANGTCTNAGFPEYVVNVSTVRDVQLAVNYARNENLRLVVKNTGHDFLGRSAGGGALSIWTHYLKDFEFLPHFELGNYSGMAARVAAGIQTNDLNTYTLANNITIITPGGSDVGAYGGFLLGGGHSALTSFYGMAADHILSLNVVLPSGRFITASALENQDIYWAMLGGGGGTFGVLTSAVVEAFPLLSLTNSSVAFSAPVSESDNFWTGVAKYFQFSRKVCEAGGLGFNFILDINGTLSFSVGIEIPFISAQDMQDLTAPLFEDLNALGFNLSNPLGTVHVGSWLAPPGDLTSNNRISSRLIPLKNFEDPDLFNETVAAIQSFVEEGGYIFQGINYTPTLAVSGYPNNSVNPAFRDTIMHANAFSTTLAEGPVTVQESDYERFNSFIQPWRDLTPGSGAYLNEADRMEPNWQESFFGANYRGLLGIKREVDPWDLFWVERGVGSEGWELRGGEWSGVTEDGRLCRV